MPFQNKSLTWVNNNGRIISNNNSYYISNKPVFTFEYNSLYAEVTIQKYVLEDVTFDLNEDHIIEIETYIDDQLLLLNSPTRIANGVYANGVYVEQVPLNELSKETAAPPTSNASNWIYDFNNNDWIRIYSIEELKTIKIEEAWKYAENIMETTSTSITTSAGTHEYGNDKETRENIIALVTAIVAGIPIPNPRSYTPKGEVIPVSLSHADFINIGAYLFSAKDSILQTYLFHKSIIKNTIDYDTLKNYDITTGY